MADERWNKARAALIASPDFDALPVEEKRQALQHLKSRLSEPVTVSKEPARLSQEQVKQSTPAPIPKPLLPQRRELPQPQRQGPPLPTPGSNIPVVNELMRGMVASPSRTAPAAQGRPTLPPEFEQGLAPSSGGMLSALSQAQPFIENVLPQFALQASPLGPFAGPLVAVAGMQGANYGTAINNGQMTREDAQRNLATDLAGTATLGPLNKLLPGNGLLQAATRNVAQGVIPAEIDEAATGRMQDPLMMAVGMGLGAAADVYTGQSPNMATVKQAVNDLVAPPRTAQAGMAVADDASFGGVFRKGDEPPTGGQPVSDTNMPPPRPPGAPTAAAAMPDGPGTVLADKLVANAEAQSRGETLPDLPRGAEGNPSDPNFQLANRTVDEPTQRVMAETATTYQDHFQDRKRGVISDDQNKRNAALLGMTDNQLQSRMKGQGFNSEQLQAALDLTEASATKARTMAEQFATLKADGKLTDADRMAFVEAVNNHAMNQAEFSGATAEVARALRVLRGAQNAKRQGEFIKKALDQFGGSEHVDELINVIANTDPADLPRTLNKIQDPTFLEMLSTLRKAGLMSGPKTAAKNVLSTGANITVQQEMVQAIAGTLDWAHAAVTGKDRVTYGASLPAMIRAGREAISKGGREAGDILRYGATPEQLLKNEATRELKFRRLSSQNSADILGEGKLNAIINMPFRVAGAGDAIMKAYVNRRYLEGMARVAAANEAKAGKIARNQIKSRARELVNNPTPVMAAEAIAEADYQTFNEANLLADKITAFTQTGRNTAPGQVLNFAKDQVMPFLKVPINYYSSQVLDMTGLRPLTRMFWSDRAKAVKNAGGFRDAMKELKAPLSNAERKAIFRAVGMGAIGTAQIMLGQSLAKHGLATGTSFSDQGDKGRDDLTNIPRGAVNLKAFGGPDKWVSSSWLFPLITMGASFQEAGSSTTDPVKQAARLAVAGGSVVLEQPFLKGMKDTVDALKNPATAGEHWLGSQAGSFVPSILNDAAGLMDDKRRQAETWTDSIKARIPGLRQTLPEKTDPFGKPMEQHVNFAFDPFQTRGDKTADPIMAELSRLKVDVTYPSDKLQPITKDGEKIDMALTVQQQNAIRSKIGDISTQAMGQLMSSPDYHSLNDDEKRDAIEHMLSTIKTKVRKVVTGQATQALQTAQ